MGESIDWNGVLVSYIGLPLFLALWLGYKLINWKHHMLASGLAHCYKSNTNVYFESIAFSFMYNSLINMEQ